MVLKSVLHFHTITAIFKTLNGKWTKGERRMHRATPRGMNASGNTYGNASAQVVSFEFDKFSRTPFSQTTSGRPLLALDF